MSNDLKPGYDKAGRRLWHTPAADDLAIVACRIACGIASAFGPHHLAGFNDHHLCEKLVEKEGGIGSPVSDALTAISFYCASLVHQE